MARTGRPTLLTPELVEQAWAYIERLSDYLDSCLPSIEGLAFELHISRDTLYQWEKDSKEFSDILEELRQAQAKKLIDKGLNSQYNSTIAKLLLSSKHGYIEKTAADLTTNGKDMPTPILGGASVHSDDSSTEAS